VLDIVAPHQNKLALTINIEGVHDAQARLTCPPPRRSDPPRKQGAHDQQKHQK